MAYGVLAYPEINPKDHKQIQDFRKENDALYYELVAPHFAFVFPTERLNEKDFVDEVKAKANGFRSIPFEIKCATVNKDAFLEDYHLLLVPDKGYSDVVKLHDRLYSGRLFEDLRLDIDFIPHMGIANSKDKLKVKEWADHWNSQDFSIKGSIGRLTVIKYDGQRLKDICDIPLQ